MKIYRYPERTEWANIIRRPAFDHSGLAAKVSAILDDIRQQGDEALRRYEKQFDHVELDQFAVSATEFAEAEKLLDSELKAAIRRAARNIAHFHASQKIDDHKIETEPGVVCWQKSVGIERVGLYVPGGTAPLFSTVLMLAIPAHIAGCKERILCTPPNREGKIHPAILYAAQQSEVTGVYKLGGVQAIGAMAFGTQHVPNVYKIFGPGNQYVTMAKQLVSLKDVAIDMPAGPSEVEVIADHSTNPAFAAADFLSQAEHGSDSQSLLVTTDEAFIPLFMEQIDRQLNLLPRKELASQSLEHSKVVLLQNQKDVMDFTNAYAPEHLIIQTANYMDLATEVRNAGSVFLGPYTPESAGDYASGTNHTLPTNGYAKAYSGVNLDSFVRKITFQEISAAGLSDLCPVIEIMAQTEMLEAHKNAVSIRCAEIKENRK
ncbi:MAG: histidinol dehydrogenase [Bacteroidales bacterium]